MFKGNNHLKKEKLNNLIHNIKIINTEKIKPGVL